MKKGKGIGKNRVSIGAIFLAFKRNDTPMKAKVVTCIVTFIVLFPIDLLPDIILLPIGIFIISKMIPKEIMDECIEKSDETWNKFRLRNIIIVIIIILLYVFIIITFKNKLFK